MGPYTYGLFMMTTIARMYTSDKPYLAEMLIVKNSFSHMMQPISSKPDVAQHTARLIKKDYEIFHGFTA